MKRCHQRSVLEVHLLGVFDLQGRRPRRQLQRRPRFQTGKQPDALSNVSPKPRFQTGKQPDALSNVSPKPRFQTGKQPDALSNVSPKPRFQTGKQPDALSNVSRNDCSIFPCLSFFIIKGTPFELFTAKQ